MKDPRVDAYERGFQDGVAETLIQLQQTFAMRDEELDAWIEKVQANLESPADKVEA